MQPPCLSCSVISQQNIQHFYRSTFSYTYTGIKIKKSRGQNFLFPVVFSSVGQPTFSVVLDMMVLKGIKALTPSMSLYIVQCQNIDMQVHNQSY